MDTSQTIRWSGMLPIFTGVLLFFFGTAPLIFMPISEPLLQWVLDDRWFQLNLIAFVLTLLTPLALIGLYASGVGICSPWVGIGFVTSTLPQGAYAALSNY